MLPSRIKPDKQENRGWFTGVFTKSHMLIFWKIFSVWAVIRRRGHEIFLFPPFYCRKKMRVTTNNEGSLKKYPVQCRPFIDLYIN